MKVSQKVTSLIQAGGKRLGLYIIRSENTLERKRQRVLEALSINVVLDVGANVGNYGRELRRNGFGARIISFEPILEVFAQLRAATVGDPQWSCYNLALGEKEAQTEINVSQLLQQFNVGGNWCIDRGGTNYGNQQAREH